MKSGIRNFLNCLICLTTILAFAGCEQKSEQGIVILKEHIPVREKGKVPAGAPKSEKPVPPNKPVANEEEMGRGDGTINVDGYVMRPDVRGTGQDPRAGRHEQWIVTVRLVSSGYSFPIQTDKAQFEKLNQPDMVQVIYRISKLTKKVWDAEIK